MNRGTNNSYFGNIKESVNSLLLGLKLTIRHFFQAKNSRKPIGIFENDYFEQKTGIFTLQYPKESIPVPDNGRYRLHNEIEDCIVCDKCAKICPVDCIDIEPIKSTEEIGKTSDGTPKRLYAAKFDIDMAKCCFCGLCTTVCPTECLTMTKSYDFSEFDVADHVYAFSEMTPLQILEKKQELEKANQAKELAKAAKAQPIAEKDSQEGRETKSESKPAFKPRVQPKPKTAETAENKPEVDAKNQALELMRAKTKKAEDERKSESEVEKVEGSTAKLVFRPRVPQRPSVPKPENKDATEENSSLSQDKDSNSGNLNKGLESQSESTPKPAKPVFKPKVPVKRKDPEIDQNYNQADQNQNIKEEIESTEPINDLSSKPSKPVFKPKIPVKNKDTEGNKTKDVKSNSEPENKESSLPNLGQESKPKPAKPVFRPKIPVKKSIENKDQQVEAGDQPSRASEENKKNEASEEDKPANESTAKKPKPVFKPRVPPRRKPDEEN